MYGVTTASSTKLDNETVGTFLVTGRYAACVEVFFSCDASEQTLKLFYLYLTMFKALPIQVSAERSI